MSFRIVDRRMSQGPYLQPATSTPEPEPPRPDIMAFVEAMLREAECRSWSTTCLLADVASKRAILAEHPPQWRYGTREVVCESCNDDGGEFAENLPYPCPTMRALASAWNWHPDYQQEWVP